MIRVTGYTSPYQLQSLIRSGVAFTNSSGSFSGDPGGPGCTGELPLEWRREYLRSEITYTVYSYETPIAWLTTAGETVIPAVTYSRATSQHQWRIRQGMLDYREIPVVVVK